MRKYTVYAILLCLVPGVLFAGYERPGSTSGQFLKIGVSARAIGMGGAFVAVAEDASAIFYNPACLAQAPSTDLLATHTEWFAAIKYDFIGLAHNFGEIGTLAISFATLYTDEMEVRTPLRPDGTGQTFYVSNYRAGIGFARFLTDRAALGLNFNYIRMDLWRYTVHSWTGDLGVFFQTGFKGFRFGMRISNFGPNLKFISESYSLPVEFAFGAAFEPIKTADHSLTLAITGVKPTDDEQKASAGVEYWFKKSFALRAGQKFGYDTETWSFGVGFKSHYGGVEFRLDYALSNFGILSNAHRFTLGISF